MKKRALFLVLTALIFSSCAGKEDELFAPEIVQEDDDGTIATMEAAYNDVIAVETLKVHYITLESSNLSFDTANRLITEVNVKRGDFVEKGDVLARIDLEDDDEILSSLSFNVKELELKLSQEKEMKDFELEEARVLFEGYTKQTDKDKEAYKKKVKNLTETFDLNIKRLEDELYIAKERLYKAREDYDKGVLKSPISGQVTFVQSNLLGSYSETDRVIFTICDLSTAYFVTDAEADPSIVTYGETYPITYRANNANIDSTVTCVEAPDESGKIFFVPTLGEEVPVNTDGSVDVETARKEHVLTVNTGAVHEADGRNFVYLYNDGSLSMQYVETGVSGATLTEIVSGLKEGDLVALKK